VGALQYATITRPEISFSVNKVYQFMSDTTEQHWAAVKIILRYLAGTINFGLSFLPSSTGPSFSLHAYCDADWASDPDDTRSTSEAAVFFGSNLVSWWSKKQSVVARSSTEAEYRSLALATAEVTWIKSLLSELHIPCATSIIFCDNMSIVREKFILEPNIWSLIYSFVREKVIAKHLQVVHVLAVDQRADILTKALTPSNSLLIGPSSEWLKSILSTSHELAGGIGVYLLCVTLSFLLVMLLV